MEKRKHDKYKKREKLLISFQNKREIWKIVIVGRRKNDFFIIHKEERKRRGKRNYHNKSFSNEFLNSIFKENKIIFF